MIAACRDKRRAVTPLCYQFKSQQSAIKIEGALEIGNLKVDVADFCVPGYGVVRFQYSNSCVNKILNSNF